MRLIRIKKRWWGVLAITLLLLVFCGGDEAIEVTTSLPTKGAITETIPANGRVRPVSEVHISPDVSGEIVDILCQEGDNVRKGDLLLKIKPDIYISLLDQATAALNISQAQFNQQRATLEQARSNYERCSTLYHKGVISLSEYEEALSQYTIAKQSLESANFQIQSARASVMEARENLSKTSIYSPIEGTVTRLLVEKGERVVGTSQMAGTEIMRIADLTRMEIALDVNENDIIKVSRGDTAQITVDALRGVEISGIVTKIGSSSRSTGYSADHISSYEVIVLISGNTEGLRPGMSASVTIITDKKDGIITIPLRCINSNGCIFVVENGRSIVRERKIVTGIQDISRVEVIGGLDMDEEVVTGPYEAINKSLTDDGKVFIDRDKH